MLKDQQVLVNSSICSSSLITDEPLPPSFEVPESYNQLNSILTYYNLPSIYPTDSAYAKAQALHKIKEKIKELDFDEECIFMQLKKIEESKSMEASCDLMEVELANLKVDAMQKFQNKNIDELQSRLKYLKEQAPSKKIKSEYESYKTIVDEIQMGTSYKYLSFYKDRTKGQYLKQRVVEKLKDRNDDCARVLLFIAQKDVCRIDDIVNDLKIDRVDLLRIIYSFSAKEVLDYDRLNDSVSIKMRE